MISYQKVGGLTFIRLGRLSFSYCITRRPVRNPMRFQAPEPGVLAIDALILTVALSALHTVMGVI